MAIGDVAAGLQGAGDIASGIGSIVNPPEAPFSKNDLRAYLNQLYRILGFGYRPNATTLFAGSPWSGKGGSQRGFQRGGELFFEEGGPQLGIFGIGPEARARKLAFGQAAIQPTFQRQRARLAQQVGGNQPGLGFDLTTQEASQGMDIARRIQLDEDQQQQAIVSRLMEAVLSLLGTPPR